MNKLNILVTGSSGTIGTKLCEDLIKKGHKVKGIDKSANKWKAEINKITNICDLRNKEELLKIEEEFDLIIHLAANSRVYNSVIDPSIARDNFEILFNILEFSRIKKINKFIFASSREVYGNSDQTNHSEEEAYVRNCESPYTATKIGGEAILHSYNQCYGIEYIIFRFSNVYGMYDSSDRLIPLYISLCKKNEDLKVYGEDKLLDFTYIDDAINGIILCIDNFEKTKNDIYNIANGTGTKILEVAKLTKELMKSTNQIKIEESRTGEVVKYIADISKAKEKLGYKPKTNILEGIKKSIEWYSKNYQFEN